jgi:hypothetical protein
VYALVQVPVLLAAVRLIPWLRPSRLLRLLVFSTALAGVSLSWSQADVAAIGIPAVFGLCVMLGWVTLVASSNSAIRLLAVSGRFIVAFASLVVVLNLASGFAYSTWEPPYTVVAVALFADLLWATRTNGPGERVPVTAWGYWILCLGLLALSTFRAVTIGVALGLGYFWIRSRASARAAGYLALLGVLIAAPLYLLRFSESEVPTARTDLRARYEQVGSDRFSGRLDIWVPAMAGIRDNPSLLVLGTGIGGVDRYLGVLVESPTIGPDQVPREHSHNSLLEMLIGLGAVGLILGLWIAWMVLRRLFVYRSPQLWALWIGVFFVGWANVPGSDYISGGALLLGFAFGAILRPAATSPYRRPVPDVRIPPANVD